MRFTIRDLVWLVTGVSIAFAILGAFWRHEHATWNRQRAILTQERAAFQADWESEKVRANTAESELRVLERQGMLDVVIAPQVTAAKLTPGDSAELTLRTDGNLDYRVVRKSAPNASSP